MTHRLVRPMALALNSLTLASCSETTTSPESADRPASITSTVAVISNTWIKRANLLKPRYWPATAVVTNAAGQSTLYAVGGRANTAPYATLTNVEAYNVATNTWLRVKPLPVALHATNGIAVIGGKLYLSGGENSDEDVGRAELWMYNPATNTWTAKRNMPGLTARGVTGAINGKLYVVTHTCDPEPFGEPCEHWFFRYDPATDQWATLPSAPHIHNIATGGVIGGKFYVVGGAWGPDINGELDVYDPATNQWTTKAPMGLPRYGAAGAALGGKLYVFGGVRRNPDGSRGVVRTTSVYNPTTDSWTNKQPMPDPRYYIAASRVVLNGKSRIEVVGWVSADGTGTSPGNNLQYIP